MANSEKGLQKVMTNINNIIKTVRYGSFMDFLNPNFSSFSSTEQQAITQSNSQTSGTDVSKASACAGCQNSASLTNSQPCINLHHSKPECTDKHTFHNSQSQSQL